MNKNMAGYLLWALPIIFVTGLCAADPQAWAVPTFESLGLYYNRAAAQEGVPGAIPGSGRGRNGGRDILWYTTSGSGSTAGSLVGLKPDTPYDIRLEAGGEHVEFQARTLSEEFPIGKTIVSAKLDRRPDAGHPRRRRGERRGTW